MLLRLLWCIKQQAVSMPALKQAERSGEFGKTILLNIISKSLPSHTTRAMAFGREHQACLFRLSKDHLFLCKGNRMDHLMTFHAG